MCSSDLVDLVERLAAEVAELHQLGAGIGHEVGERVDVSRLEAVEGTHGQAHIDLLVEKMKLSFGMDVTKYNIEPKKKTV